jgi:hypothetical protein
MKEITFIIILTFLNLISTAQSNNGQIERLTISYNGDSTLLTEKYEIDIVNKKVFSITPIMNYLDIKGTKYRTHIKFNRQSWTELTDLINRIDFSKLDSINRPNKKITYYIEMENLRQEIRSYSIMNEDESGGIKDLFEIIRKTK